MDISEGVVGEDTPQHQQVVLVVAPVTEEVEVEMAVERLPQVQQSLNLQEEVLQTHSSQEGVDWQEHRKQHQQQERQEQQETLPRVVRAAVVVVQLSQRQPQVQSVGQEAPMAEEVEEVDVDTTPDSEVQEV